jgi:hypothetical protein
MRESLAELRAREQEVEREWRWLQETLNEVARVRSEDGDAHAFRLMQAQAMRVGMRRVELRMRMAAGRLSADLFYLSGCCAR